MKKILFIIPTLTQTNGVAAFIINYLNNFNLDKFKIEIIYNNLRPSKKYIDFFEKKGIQIYSLPYVREVGLKKYRKEIATFFEHHNDYDLVYSNVGYQTYFFYEEGKKYGINEFAIHAHGTQSSDSKIKNIIGGFLQGKVNKFCKYRFACSRLAGQKIFKSDNFIVVNNAVDYGYYRFAENFRNEIRDKFNIDTKKKVIGFVGRFVKQKNVFFFIDFAQKINSDFKIMMIGTGGLKSKFLQKARKEKIEEKFIFIDETPNVNKYYSAFDYFLLPSLFEGLPVVGVEAQVNGLPCLFSDTISDECKISDNTVYLDRNNIDSWIENINNMERNDKLKLNDDFNINVQAKKFEELLSKIVNE